MKSSAGLKLIKTAENLDNWTKKLTSFQKSFFINILFPVQETYASLKYFFFFSKIFFLLFGGFPKDDILTNVYIRYSRHALFPKYEYKLSEAYYYNWFKWPFFTGDRPRVWVPDPSYLIVITLCTWIPQLVCLLKYVHHKWPLLCRILTAHVWLRRTIYFQFLLPWMRNDHPITINFFHQRTFAFSPWSLLLVANVGTQVRTRLVRQVEWIISVLIHLVNLI